MPRSSEVGVESNRAEGLCGVRVVEEEKRLVNLSGMVYGHKGIEAIRSWPRFRHVCGVGARFAIGVVMVPSVFVPRMFRRLQGVPGCL